MSADTADADSDAGDGSGSDSQPEALQTIIKASTLAKAVSVMRSVDDEAVFTLGRDGLQTRLIDPAKAYAVDIDIKPGAFESVGDGQFVVGVNLGRLDDLLSKTDGDDLVHFCLDLETRKFDIQFANVDYDMAGIDPTTIRDSPGEPDLEQPNEFSVEASHLERATDICTLASNYVDIIADPDEGVIRFTSSGDTDDANVDLVDELEFANVTEPTSAKISAGDGGKQGATGYLTRALKVIPSTTVVDAYLGEDEPIVMEWTFADGDVEVEQLIAPRLDKSS